ncbi:transposase, ISSod13 [Legionella oakridgensis]|nr:transposase, ISSod13 [Legionella oakridgensis]
MGLSRDTFYRYKSAVESGGVDALFDQNRRKPNIKNRVDEAIELSVREYAIAYPAQGLIYYFLNRLYFESRQAIQPITCALISKKAHKGKILVSPNIKI